MNNVFEKIGSLDEIDDLIYQDEDIFKYDMDVIEDIRRRVIRLAYNYHMENNADYREYVNKVREMYGYSKNGKGIQSIPVIPSTMFKITDVLSVDLGEIVKVCNSSGTKGSVSSVYRNEETLQRFLGGMQKVIDDLLNLDDAYCINLGPSTEEAADLWISYVLSLVDMIFPTDNMVIDGVFHPKLVIEKLIANKHEYENVVIIGTPVMFMELLRYLENNNVFVDGCENLVCITAGGWKRMQGQAVSQEELYNKLKTRFKGARREYCRDILNMVEINSVFCECDNGVKHVPLWVDVKVLDPFSLDEVEEGREGLLAYWDASASSYPSFILTDDIGRIVLNGKCACGRCGLGIQIIRRVESKESRGCALKIDKKIQNGEIDND